MGVELYDVHLTDWDGFDWDERKTGEDMDRAVPDPPGTHHHGYLGLRKREERHRESCTLHTGQVENRWQGPPLLLSVDVDVFPSDTHMPWGPCGGESLRGESVSIC